MQLPYWRKDAIREKAKATQKLIDAYDKQAKAAIAGKVRQVDMSNFFRLEKNSTCLLFSDKCLSSDSGGG